MELDELKNKYKEKEHISYSRKELESIFEIRTKRSVKSVNKTMLTDAMTMLVTSILLIALTFLLGLNERYFITMEISTLVVLLLIHYRVKYKLMNNIDLHKSGLKKGVHKLLKRVNSYIVAYKTIIPLFAVILYFKTVISLGTLTLEFVLMALPVTFTIYLLTSFICDNIYGRELDGLRRVYKELEKD